MSEVKKKAMKKEINKPHPSSKIKKINFSELYALKKLIMLRIAEFDNESKFSTFNRELRAVYTGMLEKCNILLDNEMKKRLTE